MANPSGTNIRAAVGRPPETSNFGDAHTDIADMIPLLSESMKNAPEMDSNDALTGSAANGEQEVIGYSVGGSVNLGMWFEGVEYFLLAAMGFENPTVYSGGVHGAGTGGSPAPDRTSSPTAFAHLFECDDVLHRVPWRAGERAVSSGGSSDPTYWTAADQKVRSLSLGIDKTMPASRVHQYRESMVQKMTMSLTLEKCSLAFDLVGQKHLRDSSMNYANWILGETDRALFTGLQMTIAPVGDSRGAAFPIQSFESSLENNLDVAKASGSGTSIIESVRGDVGRKVSGKFHLARFETEQYQTWLDDGTELQIVLTLTGGTIPGSAWSFGYDMILPKVKLTKSDFPVAGPGVITGDCEFVASKPDSTRPWLTTLLGGIQEVHHNELLVLLKNSRAACFSRDRQAAGVTLP